MASGDGIRKNVATISQRERNLLLDAFLKLDMVPNVYPDGVTFWDKQEDIHKTAHEAGQDVHVGPAFLSWHRELCNRFEVLLRGVHPELSLHYWDWTTDPRATPDGQGGVVNLFTPQFMGSDQGYAGSPFQNFESTEKTDTADGGDGIHDHIWRQVGQQFAKPSGAPDLDSDNTILAANDFPAFDTALKIAHSIAHTYIGGTIGGGLNPAHFSFHDPFVFLLHSNVDRLWAMWQTMPNYAWRLDPNQVYGTDGNAASINAHLEPWSGGTSLQPWVPSSPGVPPNPEILVKNSKEPSVVAPPCYDTTPTLAELSTFFPPNQITCGYSEPAWISIDRPAMPQVSIQLTSEDSTLILVPPTVAIPTGLMSTSFDIKSIPIPIQDQSQTQFNPKYVNIHATYCGKTLTISAEVVPPAVESVTVAPDTVVCGDSSTGTVTLNRPSLLGPVIVDLICSAPGFASFSGDSSTKVTIPQNNLSETFTITTPDIAIAFRTARAEIYTTYPGSAASAWLTVQSRVIAGILDSLTLFPSTVTGGQTSRGTVTLEGVVPTDTLVGLAAVEVGTGPLPLPGHGSTVVSVPPSVLIPAGGTSAVFTITTKKLLPGTTHKATIIAGAVSTRYVALTVTS